MEEELTARIKIRIDQIMRAQGLKRYTLAERAGISNPTIQNWYTSRNYQPTIYSLEKITKVLNVTMSELFLEENQTFYPVKEDQRLLLEMYTMLDTEGRELILKTMKKMQKD